ncbi:urease accessory protein UreD [soil metagenome]
MRSRARLHATACGWETLRSDPPLSVRGRPGVAHLVGSAAGPLGGDDLTLEVQLDEAAVASVRSVAAQVVLPGPWCRRSRLRVDATVASDAVLRWVPEPTVLVTGCRHDATARIEVTSGGRVAWREELVLGRHGEGSGSVVSTLRVVLDGRPLLHHEVCLGPEAGPGWDGPGGVGGARAVGAMVVVDPVGWVDGPPPPVVLGDTAAILPLDGPGVLVGASGSPPEVRAVLDHATRLLTTGWPRDVLGR